VLLLLDDQQLIVLRFFLFHQFFVFDLSLNLKLDGFADLTVRDGLRGYDDLDVNSKIGTTRKG
jgi:hypothetical protein